MLRNIQIVGGGGTKPKNRFTTRIHNILQKNGILRHDLRKYLLQVYFDAKRRYLLRRKRSGWQAGKALIEFLYIFRGGFIALDLWRGKMPFRLPGKIRYDATNPCSILSLFNSILRDRNEMSECIRKRSIHTMYNTFATHTVDRSTYPRQYVDV